LVIELLFSIIFKDITLI